ncbi:efflux RND transporter periplasmic adaptor subunit [Gemmatimonas groenlandica]|uniref:HlyD family efflux transporter periplasmic adaptor subunit n=1 Tax=Gemmatimonas groenlandica TaxID=2732249 RepID=A0A6M4IVF8_9BACT|nr:HlyD family efflux transporter periplasmic adaptor subunit [Gemmatimonas groenlandica]QJR37729.1 HlyD family efflux transporter periplasmic adaptor subunit [Gemmatimonas groenlandica]
MDIIRTPTKSYKRQIIIGAAITVVVLVTVALTRLDPAVPTVQSAAVVIDTVKQGDVVREVRGPGTLVPEHIRWITAQASARVERVNTESGSAVKAGDLLLELSNPDLQIQTMQAEQQVQQAQIDLINLRTNLRSAILTQEGTVASTRTQYVSSSQEARAADSLVRMGLVPAFEATNRKASAEEFTTRVRVEQERLSLMRQAIDSQIAVQASRVVQLRAIADNQQARLRSLQVRAPDAGVLQELTLQLGQWVPEGTTLAKVVQPGQLKAVLRIPESQAKDVQLGQRASIDTRNGLVSGKVMRKDPSAQGGSVTIDVALDGALPSGAVPDLSVDGTIVIDRMANVRYSGRPTSSAGSGTTSVFRLDADGSIAVRVPVTLGRSSVNTIEILNGLSVGDRIILSDMSSYANVNRVRIK